jgi:biopolymer transport protein ExbD
MQTGSSNNSIITDINVTPLVDVCLVLVIIFMVVSPLAMQASIEVASTRVGAPKAQAALTKNVDVVLDARGGVTVNGAVVSWINLPQALKKAISRSHDRMVGLKASPKAPLGRVVEILDDAKQNGAKKVALINPKEGIGGS